MKVIKITQDSAHTLIPVFQEWLNEADTELPINAEAGVRQFHGWLKNPDYAVFGLFHSDGAAAGLIIGHLHEYTFTNLMGISEIAWYVRPEARGYGKLLLNALEHWGRAHGAKYMLSCILLSSGDDTGTRAIAALHKRGFKEFERTFYKPLTS